MTDSSVSATNYPTEPEENLRFWIKTMLDIVVTWPKPNGLRHLQRLDFKNTSSRILSGDLTFTGHPNEYWIFKMDADIKILRD